MRFGSKYLGRENWAGEIGYVLIVAESVPMGTWSLFTSQRVYIYLTLSIIKV